jgi:NAD(P)H-dependent FMN reductase
VQQDDFDSILQEIDSADALVLGSPVNFFNVTAIFRRFLERLAGYAYWPWGQRGPTTRNKRLDRKAALVASSAMPGFLIPLFTGAPRALRTTANILGARPIGKLWIGLSALQPHQSLSSATLAQARRIGLKLG